MYDFIVRHYDRNFIEAVAAEMHGTPRTVMRTSGKVRAWTRWGARRWIRKLYGSHLIEIIELRRSA